MKKFYLSLAAILLGASQLFAQIPNAGFETWNGTDPASWSTLNTVTGAAGVYTATQGTPAPEGSSYLKLTCSYNALFAQVLPAVALSSTYDFSSGSSNLGGFAYTSRPVYFNGMYQYSTPTAGADQGLAAVLFTKWNTTTNSRDTIGIGEAMFDNMSSWTAFSAPISYFLPDNPDTCLVLLEASTAASTVDGSTMSIDKLALANTPTAINEVAEVNSFSVFPNPAVDRLNLELGSFTNGNPIQIQVMDIVGSVVMVESVYTNSRYAMNVAALSKGAYVIRVSQNGVVYTQKFIKK